MGLCKTSNISIFTFINTSDLKFCTPSYSGCVYIMMRFSGLNEKVCKIIMSHFGSAQSECLKSSSTMNLLGAISN